MSGKTTPSQVREVRTRCILVHGFNGEPVDMYELEHCLRPRGFAVTTMLLPGHGTSARDFAQSRWEQWVEAVRGEVARRVDRGEQVILIGHSMGGALSLATAAAMPGVAGVAALCAPVRMDAGRRGAVARARGWLPYVPSLGEDVRDWFGAHARYERKAYHRTPLATAHSLFEALPAVRQALPAVGCPALLIYARHDHVVPFADALEAYKLLGTADKDLMVLPRSFHSVIKDLERDVVCERVAAFCERLRDEALAREVARDVARDVARAPEGEREHPDDDDGADRGARPGAMRAANE